MGAREHPSSSTGAAATAHPPLPLPQVQLDSLGRVRRELTRLYVEAKHGRRDVADASKLANMLALIGRLIEGSEFERRLEAVEARLAERKR